MKGATEEQRRKKKLCVEGSTDSNLSEEKVETIAPFESLI